MQVALLWNQSFLLHPMRFHVVLAYQQQPQINFYKLERPYIF